MKLEDFDYFLPDEAIAQVPLDDRSASRLLLLHRASGQFEDRRFADVVDILQPGDLLVVNDTRVTALRLFGHKSTGGRCQLLLLKEIETGIFEALAKPGKRMQPGTVVTIGEGQSTLSAHIMENLLEGRKRVRFDSTGNLREQLHTAGQVPLPPYVREAIADPERYQTVYAQSGGSAAAPTAGLHFTPEILQQLTAKGVKIAKVTLDVGLDTFRPITADNPLEHRIHGERCSLSESTRREIAASQGRIVAVGTTAVRTIESFATGPKAVESGTKETKLFIAPGYRFQIVDAMFTNFHMPRTTMLMMISAFAGQAGVRRAYAHALATGYRFLSFGDSMLIL